MSILQKQSYSLFLKTVSLEDFSRKSQKETFRIRIDFASF